MPKSVLAALVATAEPDRRNYYLVHAAEDCLCDWKPTENELDMLQRSLHITYVTDCKMDGQAQTLLLALAPVPAPYGQSEPHHAEAHAP